jgi:mannose-6-phosphate isomerase-like protein (cupin superfamily)
MNDQSSSGDLTDFLAGLVDLSAKSPTVAFQELASQIKAVPARGDEAAPASCSTTSRCLAQALSGVQADESFTHGIAAAARGASWGEASRGVPQFFAGGYAYAILASEQPPVTSDSLRIGLLLQQSEISYPEHAHDAEEFYFILSGKAKWQVDETSFDVSAGDLIHHPPAAIHAMQTTEHPLLAAWVWRGDQDGRFWYESAPDIDCPRS